MRLIHLSRRPRHISACRGNEVLTLLGKGDCRSKLMTRRWLETMTCVMWQIGEKRFFGRIIMRGTSSLRFTQCKNHVRAQPIRTISREIVRKGRFGKVEEQYRLKEAS